jgi:hypothetical protein
MLMPFDQLEACDLVVDAVYGGGSFKDVRSDPLHKILPVGNQGGFRFYGRAALPDCRVVVLYTTLADPDWPDALDIYSGTFRYFGDNKQPGPLHETERGGNELLRQVFEALHTGCEARKAIPPFFVFSKTGNGRDVRFRGLAVPGGPRFTSIEDLVAVWRARRQQRFQNYEALFTILDVPIITRTWLREICEGVVDSPNSPEPWRIWRKDAIYKPLIVTETVKIRTPEEQMPDSIEGKKILKLLHEYFEDDAHGFEFCAARIASMIDNNFVHFDVTRLWRDGGRDALGLYRIGTRDEGVQVECALEAKCFSGSHGVGVKPMSRLISRLRYRQFGIMVTTSYVSDQAYKEIKEDGHPVLIVAGRDIVQIFSMHGMTTSGAVAEWLTKEFPRSNGSPEQQHVR